MYTVLRSDTFDKWLAKLKDTKGKARILACIRSAELGNLGDVKSVGKGVLEMRIHYGPGYRVYYTQKGNLVILLLVGGDKSSQKSDIKRAMALAEMLKE
jgi:putative addiction module killer protein